VVAPRAGALAVDPALVSRDPEVVRRYREDPLVHHGKLPARTVVELSRAVEALPDTVARIRIPVLIAYGTEDRLCPPRGSVMVSERIGSSDLTVLPFEGLHHEILNEPEQAEVLEAMIDWLRARLPAGAGAPGPGPALPSDPLR
jgi:alpha-beta hydrolase superfamily lysophospholipase